MGILDHGTIKWSEVKLVNASQHFEFVSYVRGVVGDGRAPWERQRTWKSRWDSDGKLENVARVVPVTAMPLRSLEGHSPRGS